MAANEPMFTDWEQVDVDRRRPLLVDDDFSWSEPPAPRRRANLRLVERERAVAADQRRDDDRWGDDRRAEGEAAEERDSDAGVEPAAASESTAAEYLDVERELDSAWGGRLSAPAATETYEIAPYEFANDGSGAGQAGRRTVVITGRGAERYAVRPRRRRDAELSFHERAGFTPDRTAKWAVLLGVALLLGCIIH